MNGTPMTHVDTDDLPPRLSTLIAGILLIAAGLIWLGVALWV